MTTPQTDTPPLVVRQLTLHRGQAVIVADLALRLQTGDVLGLVGANGAGKSTTLQCLAGHLSPSEGEVWVAGHNLVDAPASARAHIGYLPDPPSLHNELRVSRHLRAIASLHGLKRAASDDAVARVLELCRLTDAASKRIAHLSQGYRQRVGLAQALLHQPAVLLLDEPTNGLDLDSQDQFAETVRAVSAHCAVIISSHHLSDLRACCNRMASLTAGRLIEQHNNTLNPRRDTHAGREPETVFIRVHQPLDVDALQCLRGVVSATAERDGWKITYRGDTAELSQAIAERGWGLRQLSPMLFEPGAAGAKSTPSVSLEPAP